MLCEWYNYRVCKVGQNVRDLHLPWPCVSIMLPKHLKFCQAYRTPSLTPTTWQDFSEGFFYAGVAIDKHIICPCLLAFNLLTTVENHWSNWSLDSWVLRVLWSSLNNFYVYHMLSLVDHTYHTLWMFNYVYVSVFGFWMPLINFRLLSSIKPGLVKKINRLPTPIAGLVSRNERCINTELRIIYC